MSSYNFTNSPWQEQDNQPLSQRHIINPYQDQDQDPYAIRSPDSQSTASPWNQEPSQGIPAEYYAPSDYRPPSHHHHQRQRSIPSPSQAESRPRLPPRRRRSELALPTGQDRSHQIQVMQTYEASARRDDDDANVEVLQREFPKMDGSLIAAIYGDSKSLNTTREMLQVLVEEE